MRNAVLIGLVLVSSEVRSQVNRFIDRQKTLQVRQVPDVRNIFQRVEKGIESGSVISFSRDFGSQVHVSISGNDDGYLSANQTTSVLQTFFRGVRPSSFAFSRFQDRGESPYATGRLTYVYKGVQETVQIYVSLALQDSTWVIHQFNIY